VQKGTHRGRALGFPTVNIPLDNSAVAGIFAARVIVGGQSYQAAAFADQTRKMLEAHILDADLDLYGKEIEIELLKKIRDSDTFESDEKLRAAIKHDVEEIEKFFNDV
jgi:riboflavin kinase/FMN adenylyltransferase